MSFDLGFVLLTHDRPHQAARLVSRLNRLFDAPPIAWHHDFTQCLLPADCVTGNVRLVQPHVRTRWAQFCVVEATLAAIELLIDSNSAPKWFILLSGSDYPIKSAERIVDDFANTEFDVHINYDKVSFEDRKKEWVGDDAKFPGFGSGNKGALYYSRFCSLKFRVPLMDAKLKWRRRTISVTHPAITGPFLPFSREFSCFAGEHWFCANRAAAEYLVNFHKAKPALAAHYRRLDKYSVVPEESYYHTIWCNAPNIKVSANNWRYVDWSRGGWHPKTLTIEDLPKLQSSSAHFARKFDPDVDKEVFEALDALNAGIWD